jgi:hypothetical protein
MRKYYEILKLLHTFSLIFSLTLYSNKSDMKNKNIVHSHEEAKIYRNHYKPSFNLLRFFKSVLSVFISGSSSAASSMRRK